MSKRMNLHVAIPVTAALLIATALVGCGRKLTKEDRLVAAARNNDVAKVDRLLKEGANIDEPESGMLRQTALIASATIDGTNTFVFLLSKGANVNAPSPDGITPLMEAVTLGDTNIVRVRTLIALGADVNAIDKNRNTVLSFAKAAHCTIIVDELVKAGAR